MSKTSRTTTRRAALAGAAAAAATIAGMAHAASKQAGSAATASGNRPGGDRARTLGFKLGAFTGGEGKEQLTEYVRRTVELGFSSIYVDEEPSAVITAAYMSTITPSNVTLGTSWCRPNRHPICLAADARALHMICKGRATLGVGMIDSRSPAAYGFKWDERHEQLRDYMRATRACFDLRAGETVDYQGKYYQVNGLASPREPGAVPPLDLKVMELEEMETAGETCDIVTLGQMTPWSFYELKGKDLLRKGSVKSGRDASNIAVKKLITTIVSDDHQVAVNRLKGYIVSQLKSTSFDYKRLAKEAGFAEELKEIMSRVSKGDELGAIESVTEEMWQAYGIAGTPQEVLEQVSKYTGKVDSLVVMGTLYGTGGLEGYMHEHWKMLSVVGHG